MLGDISGLETIILSASTSIYTNPLTDSVPLSRTSLRWIRRPVLPSFSAEEDGTGSKHCSVNWTASFCSISGCLSTAVINGPESNQRPGIFPGGSLTG